MKIKLFILTCIISFVASSCSIMSYYQVYKTVPDENIKITDDVLVFEDSNCRIYYNLWADEGNIGFRFFNKTDENIYLNLEECFFILNGLAYDYSQNRTYTSSSSNSATTNQGIVASKSLTGFNYLNLLQTNKIMENVFVGITGSKGYSVSINEQKMICIPYKTSKIISEYSINNALYRDCNLYRFPKKEIKISKFTKETSPLVFSNRIVYYIGKIEIPIKIENGFYVSEITNLPEKEAIIQDYDEFCDQKSAFPVSHFKESPPYKFYLKYRQAQETWIH